MNDVPAFDESLVRDDRIDALCDRFEQQLRSGERPRIEDVLESSAGMDASRLLAELIAAEMEFRGRNGESPTAAEYMRRFPQAAEAIEEFLTKRLETVKFAREESTQTGRRSDADTKIPVPSAAHVAPAAAETECFGDYELLGEIARGGMGIVYKARQISLNRVVALKMIKSGSLAGEDDIRRFHAEAEAAAALDHPHIVPIFEVGQGRPASGPPVHFFSMGFVDGPSLAGRLNDGPLLPRDAAQLAKTLAEAVHYAHERGIVHRDLKPANVLLQRAESRELRVESRNDQPRSPQFALHSELSTLNPRITDFGLAKNIAGDSGITATGQIVGTPSYMPPEQARGDVAHVGPLADVYSLGAILYAMLAGRPPFQAANVMETLKQVLERQPVSPRQLNPAVDRDLETICLKCLEKEPHKRYGSARDFAQDVGRYLAGRPILARPIGRPARLWRWCRRNPLLATVSGLALVLVLTLSTGGPLMAARQTALAEQAETEAANAKDALAEVDNTVDRYFTKMSEEKLLDQPGMETLRKDLLTHAMAHYDSVVRRGAQDRETWKKVARAHWKLAAMTEKIGSMELAVEHHRKSLAIWKRLDDEEPLSVAEMFTFGHNQVELALSQEHAGAFDASIQSSRAALSTLEELRGRSSSLDVRFEMARANHNLSVTCWKAGRRREGREARLRARDVAAGLVREAPAERPYRRILAAVTHSLSIQHYESGELAEAGRYNAEALASRRKLARELPYTPDDVLQLARTQGFQAKLEGLRQKHREALAAEEKAVANLTNLASRHSLVTEYRHELATAFGNLGTVQMLLHDHKSAKTSFENALQASEALVKAHPDVLRFRRTRGIARSALGQFQTDRAARHKMFAGAVDDLLRVARRGPQSATDHIAYAVALNNRGNLFLQEGRVAKAVATLNDAWRELSAAKALEPRNPEIGEQLYHLFLRRYAALNAGSNAAEMAAMAAEFRPMVKGNGIRLLYVAGVFASAADLAGRAKTAPTPKRNAQRRRWADLALKTLTEANVALNQSPAFWTGYLRSNPDWRYFRRHPEGARQMNAFLKSLPPVKGDAAIRGRIAFYQLIRDLSLALPENESLKVASWQIALFAGGDYLKLGNATAAVKWLKTALDDAASIDREKLRAQGEEFSLDRLAETHFQLAVATFRKNGEKGYSLAEADFRKAVAVWTGMRTPDLRQEFQKALRVIENVRRELAKSIPHQSEANLAESLAYLGSATRRQGKIDEARDLYKRSVALYSRLADAHPTQRQYANNAINSLGNLGRLEIQNKRLEDAARWYAEGVLRLKALQKAGKADARTRWLLQDFEQNLRLINLSIKAAKAEKS